MYNSIVMLFDDRKEAAQIQSALSHLRESSLLDFDATVVSRDKGGKLHSYPMNTQDARITPSSGALAGISSDKEFVQNMLDSLPEENTALFMLTSEDDSSTALLTMLMLFAPSAEPIVLPQGTSSKDGLGDPFNAQVESYQAAVANLDVLCADSTEGEVEDIFRAVDDAYDRLVYFISAGQDSLGT